VKAVTKTFAEKTRRCKSGTMGLAYSSTLASPPSQLHSHDKLSPQPLNLLLPADIMGGDLNLKKSWHPHLRKNQERVWKEENQALEERKQIEKLRRERDEERALEELQKLQAESGGKVVTKRVDWMYSGPSGDGAGVTEEREGYLLGKRRIDNLLKSNDTQTLQKGAAVGIDAVSNTNANTARDTHKKVLEDPLLMIQKQKMELQLKAMKNAQKEAKYEEKRAKEKDRERKHRHRDRSRDRERDRKHRSRRDRSHSRSPHRRDSRDDNDDHRQRRSRSRSRHRREDRDSRQDYRKRENRHDSGRRRSRSPRIKEEHNDRDSYRRRDRTPPRRSEDAAERLAQMQVAASSLEEQRAQRVREQEAKDAEEEARHKKSMDGGRRFISSVRGQASNMDLGDAIARGRQNLRTEVD
jgi:hypothetical protein